MMVRRDGRLALPFGPVGNGWRTGYFQQSAGDLFPSNERAGPVFHELGQCLSFLLLPGGSRLGREFMGLFLKFYPEMLKDLLTPRFQAFDLIGGGIPFRRVWMDPRTQLPICDKCVFEVLQFCVAGTDLRIRG